MLTAYQLVNLYRSTLLRKRNTIQEVQSGTLRCQVSKLQYMDYKLCQMIIDAIANIELGLRLHLAIWQRLISKVTYK